MSLNQEIALQSAPPGREMASSRRSGRLLFAGGLGLVLVAALLYALISNLGQSGVPKRQTSRVVLLPDTPPPPPPPPSKEQPAPTKMEARQQPMPDSLPKPPPPTPTAEALKMEGAAGDGPSAFQSGSVNQEYKGGPLQVGGASAPAATMADRAAERLFANSVRQALQEAIERQLPANTSELMATFSVWLSADGTIVRTEITGLDADRESVLRSALDRGVIQLRTPVPSSIVQPLRFKLTVKSAS